MSDGAHPKSVGTSDSDIEHRKLQIEERKLELEVLKIKWTALSVMVPLLVVAATIFWGIRSTREQAALTFQLEAAKTVMAAKNFAAGIAQATFLRENFQSQLGADFLPRLDEKNFPDAPNVGAKWDFLQLVAPTGLKPDEVGKLYRALFPDDNWIGAREVQDVLAVATSRVKDCSAPVHPTR